ncbi:MAG: hypothetical protein ASARMPREDX12_000682 [Alectoria sarmentosa]|nr:MAG: hypothetical protein ASARMPREDX12_000682 [Alectoria sarmentosa]
MFSLPVTMHDTSPISSREIPCALKRHIRDGVNRKILGSFSEYGCQWPFIDWVENYRLLDPDIEEDELRMCPIFRNKDYKLHLADKFVNWIHGRRSEKRRADAAKAEFEGKTDLDKDSRPRSKEELSTGHDIPQLETSGSDPESLQAKWIDEKANYRGPDNVCLSELASRPFHELCDPSAPGYETCDSSFSAEMLASTSYRRGDPPEALDPNDGAPGRRSFLNILRGTPAIDPRFGNRYTIHVSTDILREVSDSKSTESPSVETTISSSPKHKSLDLSGPPPTWPQSNSSNTSRTLPLIPISNDTHTSRRKTSSCSSFSTTDPGVVKRTSSDKLNDVTCGDYEMNWQPQNQHEPSLMTSSLTDIEMTRNNILAGNTSSDDTIRPDEPRRYYPVWTHPLSMPHTSSPTPADSLASNVVFPISPDSGLSSPFSNMFSQISTIDTLVSSPSDDVFPLAGTREGLDQGTTKHHEDAVRGWIFPNPPKEPDLIHSAFNASELRLPIQRPISEIFFSSASGAQRTKDSVPHRAFSPSHRRFKSEGWGTSFTPIQPRQSSMESSQLAGFIDSSGIDEASEPEAPSSMMESILTQADALNQWSPVFLPPVPSSAPPAPDIPMDSSFMYGSTKTLRAEMPVPNLHPVNINVGDDALLYELQPPVGGSDQPSSFGLRHFSGRRPDVALCRRRQMDVQPLSCLRSDISSPNNETQEAIQSPRRSELMPKSLTPSLVSPQSQSRKEQESGGEASGPESDAASAHQQQHNPLNAPNSPSAMKMLPHCFDHGSLLVTHSPAKQTQVEELQALVGVMNDDWMQRLKLVPEFWQRCNILPARDLFEKGIWTLREYFRGRFAQTFQDVFAFLHLAFATAFFLHHQQDIDCLDTFFEDALQWQHTLSDEEDKILFLKAMDSLSWLSELQSDPSFNSDRHKSSGSITSRKFFNCSDQKDLLHILKNSVVFKTCIGFLDGKSILIQLKTDNHRSNRLVGFEEAGISERTAQIPASALALFAQSRTNEIKHMINYITRPLQRERGIEALRRIVIDTELGIAKGLLQTTREVEVTLNTSGRWRSESPEVFERYHNLVTHQCNKTRLSLGSDPYTLWRNDHYIVDLDGILRISKEQDRRDSIGSAVKLWPDFSEVIHLNQPDLYSPAPWSSISNGAETLEASPNSLMSWTPPGSSKRPEIGTQLTSPTDLSQVSSPTSLTPNTPTTSVI